MTNTSSQNKTITKNTVFLYIRMIVTMLISFYTSRVLLRNLGVEDFGTYGIAGGIVTLFASLKTMFTVATQRFLNIEIGRGDLKELNKIFNVSVRVNFLLAVIFIIVVEIGGIWLLENKLHIAPDRMTAARWVLQFSIIAATINIFNIPFSANIIAREKMGVFAAVSIYDAVAKLAIVLLLPVLGGDRLVVYGLLMLLVVCSNLLIEVLYCRVKFSESKLHRYSYKEIRTKFQEMFAFSGWAFFGNLMFAVVNEGTNILLNIFGGVVANAARTIAYQVRGALNSVVTNVYIAVKPQAIQSYARNDMGRYYKLMFTGAKVVGYMYVMMAIPLYFTLEDVLMLWLGTVPEYATSFLTVCFVHQTVRVLHESVGSFFVTIGRLKEYQITELIVSVPYLPLSYVLLKYFAMPLYGVFLLMALMEITDLIAITTLAKRIGNFDVKRYLTKVILPYGVMTLLCIITVFFIKILLSIVMSLSTPFNALILIALAVIFEILLLFYIGMSKEERNLFLNMIKSNKK